MFNINYTFHWNQAFRALPQMLDGALVTLQIAVLSMIIGTVAGVLLALAKEARTAPLRWFDCRADSHTLCGWNCRAYPGNLHSLS